MDRSQLTDELCRMLLRHGYAIKCVSKSCFDIVARGTHATVLLRILKDVNALTSQGAEEMRRFSRMAKAVPVVIAESAGKPLEDGVLYLRAGIYTVSVRTFEEALKGRFPVLLSTPAGITCSLSGEALRAKREEGGLSRSDLSRRLGISPKMVDRYESDSSEVTVGKGKRLYDLFGEDVFSPVNLFDAPRDERRLLSEKSPSELSDIAAKYAQLGFDVTELRKAPFDMAARDGRELILTDVGEKVNPEMHSLARLIDADNLLIFEGRRPKEEEVPAMAKDEFLELAQARKLVRFLKKF